ncbi:hypothetical protein LINGRAHAP2_LOCUS871 [Linum grandiflorum]
MTVRKENQEVSTFCPILSRLDRLDRMLKFVEDKDLVMGKAPPCSKAVDVEDECISLSAALELVQHKGSVVERLEFLENRVIQLSLEMAEGNSRSRTSSPTVDAGDEDGGDCQHLLVKAGHKKAPTERWTRRSSRRRGRKWAAAWRWMHMGCTT